MKDQKHIAIYTILLLWAGLLCLSGFQRAELITPDIAGKTLRTTAEHLTAEEQAFPIAWSEPSAPHRATNPVDPALPLLLLMAGIQAHLFTQLNQKPVKATFGFSSLTEQFRILPNAP